MIICEFCNLEHDGSYASGRFCSKKCSTSFSSNVNKNIKNLKISKSLSGRRVGATLKYIKPLLEINCKMCNILIYTRNSNRKFCSVKCSREYTKGKPNTKLTSEEWSIINKRSYINGNNFVSGGTTKWYVFNGFKVQGTYELRTLKILISWKERKLIKNFSYTLDRFQYIGLDNKQHSYNPDFKIINLDDSFYYIEVKGRMVETDILKIDAVKKLNINIQLWKLQDIVNKEKMDMLHI